MSSNSSSRNSLPLKNARRIVVKVGSSLVTNEGRGVDADAIGNWCRQLAALANEGRELVMVSSGAIVEGMKRLGWATRPKALHELQAAAAVGQMGLAQMYETKLREQGMGSAQVLLTHADLADRERYLNASLVRHSIFIHVARTCLQFIRIRTTCRCANAHTHHMAGNPPRLKSLRCSRRSFRQFLHNYVVQILY